MDHIPELPEATAASDLVNSAVMASLVRMLLAKGLLSGEDVREMYEGALHLIEEQQAGIEGDNPIFDMARDLLERHLR